MISRRRTYVNVFTLIVLVSFVQLLSRVWETWSLELRRWNLCVSQVLRGGWRTKSMWIHWDICYLLLRTATLSCISINPRIEQNLNVAIKRVIKTWIWKNFSNMTKMFCFSWNGFSDIWIWSYIAKVSRKDFFCISWSCCWSSDTFGYSSRRGFILWQ